MQLTRRKKLEIFIEAHALSSLEKVLGESGLKGWSVFNGLEGSGLHGAWRQTGVVESEARLVIAIGSETACEPVLDWLSDYFRSYPGVVAISDVSVMRAERF